MGSEIIVRGLPVNQLSSSEKIVLYLVCFVYSLLSLLVLLVILVFPLLSY